METQPKPRRDTDPWLVFTLTSHSEKLNGLTKDVKKINDGLKNEIARSVLADGLHDERIARHRERIEGIEKKKPNNPNSNTKDTVTFKWILEKLALPIVMFLIGGAIALLYGA
jgi:hypothetical protein